MKKKKNRDDVDTVVFEAEPCTCPHCGKDLCIVQHRERWVETLDGVLHIISKDRGCNNKDCPYYLMFYHRPIEETIIALNGREFGLDIIIYIGESYLQDHNSLPEIHEELREKFGVDICEKTVCNLYQSYLALCNCVDGDSDRLQKKLRQQGGVILEVDGVQFDDRNPVLYLIKDAISGETLYGKRTVLRGKEDLIKILEKVKEMDIPIIAIVTDKERGLVPAIETVFPGIPYQWCQYHFLKNLAIPMEEDLKELGESIRKGLSALKELRKKILKKREKVLKSPEFRDPTLKEIELALDLCDKAIAACKTSGKPPLDPTACKRYKVLFQVREAVRIALQRSGGPWRLLKSLRDILAFLDDSRPLEYRIWERLSVIRKVAHIFKMESNSGQVRRVLRTLLNQIQSYIYWDRPYMREFVEHVITVTESYWNGLFQCYENPLIPKTSGEIESEFGSIKRSIRRTTGRKSTAGGVMESVGEFVFKAKSLLKNVNDLANKILTISYESYKKSMNALKKLQEPARSRRSFLRNPISYLENALHSWFGKEEVFYVL